MAKKGTKRPSNYENTPVQMREKNKKGNTDQPVETKK
jgi:hypothetical protein